MSEKTPNPPSGETSGSTPPLRGFGGAPYNGGVRVLFRDKKFRWAWGISLILHAVLFATAAWSPSSANYRFFGSGTAVSLVGVDEIPGGSARGKSGDRPEDVQKPKSSGGGKARKIAAPEKKSKKKKTKARKRRVRKKKFPPKKSARKLLLDKKKKNKKKKKKMSRAHRARLKRRRARRARLKKWRNRQKKVVKGKAKAPSSSRPPSAKKSRKTKKLVGDRVAKVAPAKPKAGYPGEGGGDGQGGGSLGGGSGGVARTEIDRYYGLLGERVRNFWTVPEIFSDLEKLRTVVIFDVSREGEIRRLRIEKTSGNRIYDTAALRAVQRAANPSLPRPPNTVTEEWLQLGFRFCGKSLCR